MMILSIFLFLYKLLLIFSKVSLYFNICNFHFQTFCIMGDFFIYDFLLFHVGVEYKDDCRADKYIPIYLIVLGAFGVLRNIVGLYTQIKSRSDDDTEEDQKKSFLEKTIDCFLVAWFICGNVWIYRIHNEVNYTDKNDPLYCDQTLYLFAFWLTTASYILVGTLCCCMCLVGCCSVMTEES